MTSYFDRHQCALCPTRYFASLDGKTVWDGLTPCPCGNRHLLCVNCTSRYDLLDDGEWGAGVVPLKTCPLSDEFRTALELMGPGAVVEPRPREAR